MACREYTLPRDESLSEPTGWIRGNTKIGPVLEVTTCCLQGKYGVEIRIESIKKDSSHSWVRISHGLNKLVTNLNNKDQDDNEQETSEMQFEDYALKLNAGDFASRSKAKAKPQRRTSASSSTKTILLGRELGPILNHKIIRPPIIQCRRNWSIFFVMVDYLEKMMERLNSGDQKIIFRTILCIVIIGLMKSGRASWQKEEETRKDFSIVLMLQEKFFTSELFKVIQDAILLILHCRTMSLFPTVSSSTFITLDVQSIYIPSSIQDWYREVNIWAIDRQYSFFLWFLWTKNTRILRRSTWKHRVLHGKCIKHGRHIKTRYMGSTSILSEERIEVLSDAIGCHHSLHSQLVVSRKLFGWKLKKSCTHEYMNHLDRLRRFPWEIIGWRNWV